MKAILFLFSTILIYSGCQKLDSNLFNPDNTIEKYYWDDYKGEREFHIGSEYVVDSLDFNYFTVQSDYKGDKKTIHAVYLGNIEEIKRDTVIVYCHGNADHMDFYWERAKLLYYAGGKSRFGVLMMDYRGFGLSEGETNEPAMEYDVSACIEWLEQRGLTEDRMIIYGFSLGSIPAVEICKDKIIKPKKLILEAPIGNIDVMVVGASSLSMSSGFMTNIQADNIEFIKYVDQPLLWIHGVADSFLPYNTHGQPIYDNHKGPKEKILVPGGEHGDTPKVYGLVKYMNAVANFIEE
ncbi:MAG TPA: alpha/beta hydrolase [Bacteroidetes bacterium]|nr:alpha/beta hydrolase [Bacteroidota bacterium]